MVFADERTGAFDTGTAAEVLGRRRVRAVAEAVGQTMATLGAVCVFGDPGRGKTAAVRMALGEVPPGWRVTWVPVAVRPSVAGMRVVDEAQRLPVPCLEYLQSLWDHPGTRVTLVLCGTRRLWAPCSAHWTLKKRSKASWPAEG